MTKIFNVITQNKGFVSTLTNDSNTNPLLRVSGTLSASQIDGYLASEKDGFNNPHVRVVAPSGSSYYTSISESLNDIGQTLAIEIRPGYYYENPFTIPASIKLIAPSNGVYVFAKDNNVPLIITYENTSVNGIEFYGPTNNSTIKTLSATTSSISSIIHTKIRNSKTAMELDGSGSIVYVLDTEIANCTTGAYIHSLVTASISTTDFIDCTDTSIETNGCTRISSVHLFNKSLPSTYPSIGIKLNNNTAFNFSNTIIKNIRTGLYSPRGIQREILGNSLEFINVAYPSLVYSGSGDIFISNVMGDFSKAFFEQTDNFAITAFDTKKLEETARTFSDLSVGSFIKGSKLATGEAGQSSVLICFGSSSTGEWTDRTVFANDYTAPPLTFPGINTNDSLYFALNVSKSNGIGQHIYGFDFIMNSTASYNSSSLIAWETWNGSTWTNVTSMGTQLGDGYYDINTGSFDRYTSQTIRLNQNTIGTSVSRSLPGISSFSSSSQYWVRARISNSLNESPSIQITKPYSNASVFGPDGFLTMHGAARNYHLFPWGIGTATRNFLTAPADQDLGLSDNISMGIVQNSFSPTLINQIGFTAGIPLELDTSTQSVFRFSFRPSATDAGNIIWTIRYTYSQDGDFVYPSAATAPSSSIRERINVVTSSGPFTANAIRTVFASLNFEGFPTRQPGTSLSPVLWVTLERTATATADTYTGTADIFDLSGRYVAWSLGNHAAFYT